MLSIRRYLEPYQIPKVERRKTLHRRLDIWQSFEYASGYIADTNKSVLF